MKKIPFTLVLIFLLFNCSSDSVETNNNDNNLNDDEIVDDINLAPSEFEITISNISGNSALLEWTQSIDPENESVTYSIYLDGTLYLEDTTDLTFEFTELTELTIYSGSIIAKDTNNNTTEVNFSFETEKYYLKFLRTHYYAENEITQRGTPRKIIKISDGNYIIAGSSNYSSGSGIQFLVIKTDYLGNELWRRYYPYELGGNAYEINETPNGLLLANYRHVLNISPVNGDVIWQKELDSYDIVDFTGGGAVSALQDSQGNVFVIGSSGSDLSDVIKESIITKLDNQGNIIWEKTYIPSIYSTFHDFMITSNDELLILGSAENSGMTYDDWLTNSSAFEEDFWILKLTNDGEFLWENFYGDGKADLSGKIIKLSNGNYAFAGVSIGAYDIPYGRLFEIDTNGNTIWENMLPQYKIYSLSETHDNGIITTGKLDFGNYGAQGIFKYDSNGNEEWNNYYQESYTYLVGQSIIPEDDGGYRIAGSYAKNYYYNDERPHIRIYKTDNLGNYE